MFKEKAMAILAITVLFVSVNAGSVVAADESSTTKSSTPQGSDQQIIQEMAKKMQAMEQRIEVLEAQVKQQNTSQTSPGLATSQSTIQTASYSAPPTPGDKGIFGLAKSPVEGLKLGAYGEFKLGSQQNPEANGQWQNGFDASRLVLLPSYQITDNIIFNSEIEFEHGGIAFDSDDKLHGTSEVEQAYVDFKVSDYLNFHSPGIDLVPIGYTNQHHEPTTFYSVNRPELANGIIPTTFRVPSWGTVYGQINNDLGYQFQISNSIEDFGDSFDKRTEGKGVLAGGYEAGISGKEALGLSRPPVGDFQQLNNEIAYSGQLDYTILFIPGLTGSTSVYFTPNVEPRGAYSDTGNNLGDSSLTIVDSELRYRIPKTGWELRGEYAEVFFGDPQNLRANNNTDETDNVGDTMWGASGEVAYHISLGKALGGDWEAVPFYRYTYEDLQTSGFRGTDVNSPTGAGRMQFHTLGIAVFPTPKLVLKLNYQHVEDDAPDSPKSDSVLGGVGFFF